MKDKNDIFVKEELTYENDTAFYLYKILNESEEIGKYKDYYHNPAFIELLLNDTTLLKRVFKEEPMLIYNIIDYFKTHNYVIDKKQNSLIELIDDPNFEILSTLWDYVKDQDFNYDELVDDGSYFDLINNMELNVTEYYYFLFNQKWLKDQNNLVELQDPEIALLSEQLINSYYYNLINKKKEIEALNIDDDLLTEYQRIEVKTSDAFSYNKKGELFFKKLLVPKIKLNLYDHSRENKLNLLKSFFRFCLFENHVNKELISWFYVFFHDYISTHVMNDYFQIISDVKNKNLLNYVMRILKYLEKDFFQHNEKKFRDFIFNLENNTDYLGRINENLNEHEVYEHKNVVNNIFIVGQLKRMELGYYSFLDNLKLEELSIDSFHFILTQSPLEHSWTSQIFKIEKKSIIMKENTCVLSDAEQLYNSIAIRNCNPENYLFLKKNILIKNLETKDLLKNKFDLEILHYNLLRLFFYHSLIPVSGKSLKENINTHKYSLQSIKNLYIKIWPSDKKIINGYTGSR